jgi:hypothetical protein
VEILNAGELRFRLLAARLLPADLIGTAKCPLAQMG